jgi:DNA-binding MarR family transcriptional regulator
VGKQNLPNFMNPTHLAQTLIEARKRDLQGAALVALLLVLDKPMELGKIAKHIGISRAALTGLTDKLYLKGYARRSSVSGDRRKWLLEITEKGTATIEAILP